MAENFLAIRIDAGTLRAPTETPQGFLRVDGHVGRPGIYEYVNTAEDAKNGLGEIGKVRRELRPDDVVFRADTMGAFDSTPLTIDHPKQMISTRNVKALSVGMVTGAARRDGDKVAVSMTITDPKAIAAVKANELRELSPGYKARVQKGGGIDPVYGRYDCKQIEIWPNHLALVERARGGSDLQIRMDSADETPVPLDVAVERRDDTTLLTSATDGHQHTLWYDGDDASGRTSSATAEKADCSHSHSWIRNANGTITIGEDSGHTHTIEAAGVPADPIAPLIAAAGAMLDTLINSNNDSAASNPRRGEMHMETEEQIRSLKAQLADIEAKAEQRAGALAFQTERADKAEARMATADDTIKELTGKIAAGVTAAESAAVAEQYERADKAEKALAESNKTFDKAVHERAAVMHAASIVDPQMRFDAAMSVRDIQAVIVKKLRPTEDIGPSKTPAYIAGRFDSLTEGRARSARSLSNLGGAITHGDEVHRRDSVDVSNNVVDSPESRRQKWRDQAKQPIDRKAASGQKGNR